ncbi:MAG: flagellar FlbD family protein [Armatimonadetes bacterium]|nr:flagellar FlbD family protein [Armatimonadota bacterium]
MIQLTSLDGRDVVVNALLIERIEAVPDTVITLTTGTTCVVRETVDDVVQRAVDYLRSLRQPGSDETPVTVAQWGRIV